MNILNADTNKPKFTILANRTSGYPKPGAIIAVSEESLTEVIDAANQMLEPQEQFLQSSVTHASEMYYNSKTVVAPCKEEANSNRKFDVLMEVINLRQAGQSMMVEVKDPFTNLPKNVKLEFIDQDVNVVELFVGRELPNDATLGGFNSISYADKSNKYVNFEKLGVMPPKLCDWITSNCIKEFAKVFDYTLELGAIEQAYHDGFEYDSNEHKAYVESTQIDDEAFAESSKNDPITLEVIDHKKQTEPAAPEFIFSLDEQEAIQKVEETRFELTQHPLYQYTSDQMADILFDITSVCGIQFDDDKLIEIMKRGFERMSQTGLSVDVKVDLPSRPAK